MYFCSHEKRSKTEVFVWQSRGREFDSHTLHSQKKALKNLFLSAFFFFRRTKHLIGYIFKFIF